MLFKSPGQMKTVISLKKERYDFLKIQRRMQPQRLVRQLSGFCGPIGVLFGYGMGSLYGLAAGDTIDTAETSQKLTLTVKQPLLPLVQEDNEAGHRCLPPSTTPKSCAIRSNRRV